MKKTVEQKAEMAKLKIDKKLQKQKQKFEKAASKKEQVIAKKEERFEMAEQKKIAKKELREQKKAAKKEIADMKKKAKQEVSKEKKAAKKSGKENTQTTKKSKKMFAAVLAIVFIGGGISGFLFLKGQEEEKDPYVEAYVLDDDMVESISAFLGESETRALPEITQIEEGENKEIVYDYTELTDASEEVKNYVSYLTEEKDYVPMFEYNLNAPGGYVSIATASQEEGKIFKMDIDYTDTDYKIMIRKTDETLPEAKQEKNEKTPASREGALNYLAEFPTEDLGLAKPVGEYNAIYDTGRSFVNNQYCYGINLYEVGAAGTNIPAGKFFVPTDMSRVYKYSPLEDDYFVIEDTEKEAEAAKAAAEAKLQEESTQPSEQDENIEQQQKETQEQNDKPDIKKEETLKDTKKTEKESKTKKKS